MSNELKGFGPLEISERIEGMRLIGMLNYYQITELAQQWFDTTCWDVWKAADGVIELRDENYNVLRDNLSMLDLYLGTPSGINGYFDDIMRTFTQLPEQDKKFMVEVADDEMRDKYPVLKDGMVLFFNGGIGK